MKLKTLITELQKLEEQHGDLDVIVDQDKNGYYELEKAEFVFIEGDGLINLKSSNEL